MSEPLAPDYEAEIRDRIDRLDSDQILTGSMWQASSVGTKSVLPPEQSNVVEDVLETGHAVIPGSVGVFASKLYAEFTAHARDDIPALLAELDRVRAERDQYATQLDGIHLAQWEDAQEAAESDTLPAWLYQRFMPDGTGWDNLDDDQRSYWEHQARAVRRTVARNGFKADGGDR
jgi:hypothetical protein